MPVFLRRGSTQTRNISNIPDLNIHPPGGYSNPLSGPAADTKNNDLLSVKDKVCDAKFCSRNIGKNAFSQAVSLNVRDPARRHLLGYFEAILLLRTLRYPRLVGAAPQRTRFECAFAVHLPLLAGDRAAAVTGAAGALLHKY